MDILIFWFALVSILLVYLIHWIFTKDEKKQESKVLHVKHYQHSVYLPLLRIEEVGRNEKVLFCRLKDRSTIVSKFLEQYPVSFGNLIHNKYLYTGIKYRNFNEVSNVLTVTYQDKYKI